MRSHVSVELTDDEVLLLDGNCRPEIQRLVEAIKLKKLCLAELTHLPLRHATIISHIVAMTFRAQAVEFRMDSFSYCSVCQESSGYAKYKSNSRYHRKGDENRDKPLKFYGVSVFHYTSICGACKEKLWPVLGSLLGVLYAEVPEYFTGVKPKYKKAGLKHCKQCDYEADEFQFSQRHETVCPKCGYKNQGYMNTIIESVPGKHVLVPMKY